MFLPGAILTVLTFVTELVLAVLMFLPSAMAFLPELSSYCADVST
jgi:hypothetical protein